MVTSSELRPLTQEREERESRFSRTTTASVCCFCLLTVSFVPPASKEAMAHAKKANPVALATLQLAVSSVVFAVLSAAVSRSCRGVLEMFREAAPVGAAFGVKLALMNVGLAGSSTLAHVALQSSDLMWCAAFARCVTPHEAARTFLAKLALFGCFVGSTFVAAGKRPQSKASKLALCANLAAPALQGLVVVLLRGYVSRAVEKRPRRPVALVVLEFTSAKLAVSAATAALVAAPVLGSVVEDERQNLGFVALAAALVACVQLSFSALAVVLSANSIGVVGAVKILPQVAFAALVSAWKGSGAFAGVSDLQLFGTLLLLASALLWVASGEAAVLRGVATDLSIRAPSSAASRRRRLLLLPPPLPLSENDHDARAAAQGDDDRRLLDDDDEDASSEAEAGEMKTKKTVVLVVPPPPPR